MVRLADGLDVEGPVQAELLVVWLHDDQLELTGPCGAAPWLIELGETDHPVEDVTHVVRDVLGLGRADGRLSPRPSGPGRPARPARPRSAHHRLSERAS